MPMSRRFSICLLFIALCACTHPPPPAPLAFDHVWITVSPGAPERAQLESAGFRFAPVINRHDGQGTMSTTIEFENSFLELMWVDPAVPIAPGREAAVEKFRKRMDWRSSGWSPFGFHFRRTSAASAPLPFPTWQVKTEWLPPGTAIEILTPRDDTTSPSFAIPPRELAADDIEQRKRDSGVSDFSHAIGVHRITALQLIAPRAYQPIAPLRFLERERLMKPTMSGDAWTLELTFDHGAQRKERDFRPELPLVIHY